MSILLTVRSYLYNNHKYKDTKWRVSIIFPMIMKSVNYYATGFGGKIKLYLDINYKVLAFCIDRSIYNDFPQLKETRLIDKVTQCFIVYINTSSKWESIKYITHNDHIINISLEELMNPYKIKIFVPNTLLPSFSVLL